MPQATHTSVNGIPVTGPTIEVYYTGSDTLQEGMALCYDHDATNLKDRSRWVEKPSLANIESFAGVVRLRGKTPVTGPCWLSIEPFDGHIRRACSVYTDEEVVAGDILGVIPETYAFGGWIVGLPIFRVSTTDATLDSTPGQAYGDFGNLFQNDAELSRKCVRFFDDFTRSGMVAGVANLHDYELVGTGAVFAGADAKAIAATDTTPDSTKSGGGVGAITTATSGWLANVALPGEPFALDAGKNLFFRARFAVASTTTAQFFLGLGTAAVTDAIDTGDTNGIGFRVLATVLDFVYAKDATPSVIETLTGWTAQAIASPAIAADVFTEVAFMVRNGANGTKEVTIWVNGTNIAHTTVAADVVDDESLTLRLAAGEEGTNAAMTLYMDRLEINNYRG